MQLLRATRAGEGDEEEGKHRSRPLLKQQLSTESISVSVSVPRLRGRTSLALRFFQLSNEMQLSIMKKVKSGELSIEDALDQARKDGKQLLKQQSQAEEVTLPPGPGAPGPRPRAAPVC